MPRLTRQDYTVLALLTATITIGLIFHRATSKELSVEVDSCMPRDVWAKLSRAYEPRTFWVEQHIALEEFFTPAIYQARIEDCSTNYAVDVAERRRCEAHWKELWQQGRRCLALATRLCRMEGGSC